MKKTWTIRPLTLLFSRHGALVSLCCLLIGLTGSSGVAMAENPVPLINQPLVPDAIRPGGAGFTLTVNGTGFVSGSVVHWNGNPRSTSFVSSARLKAAILTSDIAKGGTASVTVLNPSPGGGTSNVVFFEVTISSSSIRLSAPSAFGTGWPPYSVAVGDFNYDGKLDLAVAANNGSTNLSVLLGNGDGTFQAAVNYAAGSEPLSVAVGDFNGDGKLDLVVANNARLGGMPTVSVLLGNGDGTFQPAVNYGAGSNPYSVAVGDFNRDGKLDLAVADSAINGGTSGVSVLLGNGDGTFQAAQTYDTGTGSFAVSVAVGDFNDDGKLDLAVANNGMNNVSVLLGNGDGTFQAAVNYSTGSGPYSVAVDDFNRDGKLDLAVANQSNSVSVLLGNGDGTFQPALNYGAGQNPDSLAVADLNGDGKLDLAVGNLGSDSVSVLLGNGDGTFRAAVDYPAGSAPTSVAVGDFNGDGRLDMAISDYVGSVSVLLQVPTVSLSKSSLTFADQLVGTSSAPKRVTLTNTGYETITIASIRITGANTTDFSQTHTCGSSLPPRGSCTISVTFTPTQIGPRTASVTITDNGAGSPQSVDLSGTGVVSGPNATLSTKSLTFATQLVGTTSPAHPVTLSNYGTETLDITSIVANGDFSESNNCGSGVPAGGNCTINVTFTPRRRGPRTGTVSITDNAPGSPQKVSLKGTGTVVEFNPTSLNFGRVKVGHESSLTTTLTNTGSTGLNISGIKITGSSAFSQTNKCGNGVGAGGSCTITVTFKPLLPESFSGAVSVSDNGGGSPQQVPLSGSGIKGGASVAARSAIAAHSTAAVPSSTGPSNVGSRVMQMVDSVRDDPFAGDGTKRELLVRFWYPASIGQGCEPAEYTSQRVWNYFSELLGTPLPEVKTNSCLDAPITGGPHPVIVFTHGYTGTFTDYTFLFEDLASRGYVVASVDHTSEATAVEFPNGRFVKSVFGSHLAEDKLRSDAQSLSLVVSVRSKDLKFVVDELARLNGETSGPFAGKLDLTRFAVAGHSLGGLTALIGLNQHPRFKAAVLLDASLPDGSASLTETPVLVVAMGREQWSDEECRLWSDLRGPRFAVNLKGAEHLTPSDAVWLAKGAIKGGAMGPEKTITAIRDYIAAFLDTNLRGKPADPLLSGPSSDYPDAAVTTQKQLLCGEGIDH
jgi:dienelactone hydrolase